MDGWKTRRAWLTALPALPDREAKTPAETAEKELALFLSAHPELRCALEVLPDKGGSFCAEAAKVQGGPAGILYGVYRWIGDRALGREPDGIWHEPARALRVINAWDNMDGTVERGYAGRSIWFEGDRFAFDPDRIRQLGRMLASCGVNVLCLNNVNVHEPAQGLISERLGELAAFAALLRPFAVRLMVSVDFSQPVREGLDSADPLDERVCAWWERRADEIWRAVPDLAGFLIKADSEHRPGPRTYGRTHFEGANMLARAVAPHGGVIMWRAFVYNCTQDWRDRQTDRPKAAYELYMPMDGKFDDNVILQIKNGPYDFQVREPVSPLFYGMKKTRLALEVQLAQEYTGHQIDLYAMPPMWRAMQEDLKDVPLSAAVAVSNLGRDDNWFGHPFAALNLYAFGRYAFFGPADPEEVIRDWAGLSYRLSSQEQETLVQALLQSRGIYEQYTATLGLDWMVTPGDHYGPNPDGYEFSLWGTYNRADRNGVGIDRTPSGTGYTEQYPEELRRLYEDPETCPDELLLFFHRLPYDFVMKDGRTLIQRIYDDHFEGCERAERMLEKLCALSLPEPDLSEVRERAQLQVRDAREWRDVINTFFYRFCGVPDRDGRRIYP